MSDKPAFDPNAPFQPAAAEKPAFDPNAAFEKDPQWSDIPKNIIEGIKETPETLKALGKDLLTPWPVKAMNAVQSGVMQRAAGQAPTDALRAIPGEPLVEGVASMAKDYGAGQLLKGDVPGALQQAKRTTIEHPISTGFNAATFLAPLLKEGASTLGQYAGRFGENQMGKLHGASQAQFRQMGRDYFGDAMRSSYKMGDADFRLGSIGREQMIKERVNQLGQELGDIRAQANAAGPQMTPKAMQKAIQERVAADFAPGGKYFDEASGFQKNLQNIGKMPEGGIENFAERATDLRKQAQTNSMRLPVNAETNIAKEMAAINDAEIAKRLPAQADQYQMLKDEFRNAKSLDPMELRGESREALGGASNTLFGTAKNIGHALIGGPKLGAHAGFGAEGILNSFAQNANLAPWAAVFNAAAQRGPQSIISNHYILMQQDPDYNKAFMEGQNGQTGQ